MSILRKKTPALCLHILLVLTLSGVGKAQSGTGAASFGAVAIGQTSSVQTVTLTFASAGTLGSQLALTGGAQNQDFAIAAGGTCAVGQSYQAGGSCTVSATFAPLYAGLRMGAIVLEDASGGLLASTYVSGIGSGPQVGFHLLSGQAAAGFPYLGITADKGIAVDGNGNLFVSSVNSATATESVVEVPAGCSTNTCVKQLPGTFYGVWGLAVDGAGNVWVGDLGASGTITEIVAAGGYSAVKTYKGSFGNQVGLAVDGSGNLYFTGSSAGSAYGVTELVAAGGYSTVLALATGYNSLEGIAVDGAGDVFFPDPLNNVVKEIVAVNGVISSSPTIVSVGGALKVLQGVAVDGSGNLFVTTAATGNGAIYEIPVNGGYTTSSVFSNGFNGPTGIAVTGGGDLFVIDSGSAGGESVFEVGRLAAPGLTFQTPTAPGEIDTADGPQRVSIQNVGNQPMTLSGLAFSNGSFSLDSTTTTCSATATVAVGDSCVLGVQFQPTTTGAKIGGTLAVTDNALNVAGTTQSLALAGAGLFTPAVNVSVSSSVIAVSQPLTLTVTVNGGAGNPTPTGTVQAVAVGYTSVAVALSGGTASVTIPAGTLSPGSLTLAVNYQPDTASAAVYIPVSVQASVTVTSTIMNVPAVTVTPAVASISLGQALSVTVAIGQTNGAPMPTGAVTLAGGNYTSQATTLNSGTTTITIPANSLIIGTDELVATYTPDAASATIYVSAQGAGFVAVSAAATAAGAAPVDFGSIGIGLTSVAQPITLTFPANSTPASLIATTQGATGKDFAIVNGGSCGAGVNVATGQSCTVNVTFTPAFAGLRDGAVVALDGNGQMLALTYVHGSGTGAQISVQSNEYFGFYGVSAANDPFSFTTLSDGFSHPNVAVDGAGNVFVADAGIGAIREIPAGCTSSSCTVTILQAFYGPSALAVDGAGNIFVTEIGNNDVKKIPPGCTSYSCLQTVGSGFNQPYGLAVDANGNIFVADTFNNAVKEIVAAGGYTTINTIASGLDLPWSVVVNAGGDVFVAEGGDQCTTFIPGSCSVINTSLLQITAASGYKTINTLAAGIFGKPFGLAIDGGGNVYEADYGDSCATEFTAGSGYATARRLCSPNLFIYPEGMAVDGADNLYLDDVIKGDVYKMDFVDVPSMTFKTATLKGVADVQDGPQVVSVQNNGTTPLTFSSIAFSDPSFQLDSSVSTCSTSTPILAGGSCYLAVDFDPAETGPFSATLTLTDNNLNQSPATQVIQITAVALPPTPVILTNPANPTTATSATFTFSDTQTPVTFVCSIDSLPFSACSSPAAYSALSGGAHAFQVKAKDSAGNLSLAAVYNWTVNSVGPPAPVITSAPAYLTNDDTATFAFSDAQAGVSYQCSLDGAAFAACTSGISYSGMAPAQEYYILILHHSFAVKAMDASNNFSPETTRSWITDNQTFSAYPVDFGPVPVGQTSSVQSVTFNINTAATVATIDDLTMGITGLDFAVSDPGTCAVGTALSKGAKCTLKATFTPMYPGQRKGAVLLLDASGNGIGEAYMQGTGTGPQVTFGPYSTVNYNILAPQNNTDPGKNLVAPVSDVAVDGAGNVYAADMSIFSVDQSVAVSTGDIWKFPVGCTGPTCSILAATERNTTTSSIYSTSIPLILPTGITIDGAGVLLVSDNYLWPQILDTVGQWYPTECSFVAASLSGFQRAVADGAGDLALVGGGLIQSCFTNLGVGQKTQTTSFDFSTNTPSMTIDPAGNYFVADTGNNAVKEVLASSNYTIDRTVGSGFSSPYGVASDAYGNIYVSDTGNNAIKEIVASSGYTQVLTIATFDPKAYPPGELTVDALGNIYIAGTPVNSPIGNPGLTNQFFKLDFSDAPSLSFPTSTKIGTTDTTDGTLTATVTNNGNQPLNIGGLALSNTNFSIDAGATTCSASTPLAMGASCTLGVIFTPNATGALTGTLTLTDNALNASGATQQFALTGTGYKTPTTSTPTVTVAPASSSITTAQSDVVTVTVSGANGGATPTGAVSLIGGNYTSATVALNAGSATFTIPAGILAVGSTTLNAIYSPDTASSTTYGTGAGNASISVTATSTSTPTVIVTPTAIDISTQQSLVVTIAVSGGGANPTPTGSVTLSGGNYASLASTLSIGSATITIPSGYLPAGTVKLTAYYSPDLIGQANYTSALGTSLVSVEAAAKTTPPVTVTPASSVIQSNQPLLVTMQVSGGSSRSTPTGSVVLSSGSYVSATAVLSQGSVIVSIPSGALALGSDTLTASYTPDNASSLTFNSAAGSGSVTVNSPLVATTTTLQASATSVAFGASVAFSVAVSPASGTGTATGSVTLMDGTSTLTTLTLNASGTASYATTVLSAGTHSITAVYGGDSNDGASTSAAVTVTVAAPLVATTTTLQASATSIVAGSSLSLTATVAQNSSPSNPTARHRAEANGSAVPTGNVTFVDGTTSLGTATLNASGVATFSTSSLAVGSHAITATYGGDTGDAASTSAAVTVIVAAATPVATLTPASLSFTVTTGTTSAAQSVTLSNTGNTALSISGITIAGTNPNDFSETNTCGSSLAAGANCSISVTFTPAAAASFAATLSVADNASDSPQTVALTGTGAAASAPIATLSPASLSFTATTGTTAAAQAATLSNTGNAALNISSIALAGTNPTNFAITTGTNSCGETLSSGATCNIYVTFTPASAASFSASLQLTDNAAGSPQSTSLSGIGTAAVVASFTIGSSTSAQTVQPGGTATYTISATAQNGAFTTPVTLAASGLPAGATATFTPASITPGSSSATSALSIQTATTTAAAAKRSLGWPLAAPALAIVSLLFVPGKRRRRWITMALLLFAFLGAIATLTGCGGGFSLTPPAQTYTITVTGTSGAETQSTTVQLTVQ